ncbi:unnamed protein product [Caenorhabditis auriculariae]|uniref:Uncharacterized protein n=1 Tax=Caenorhabditis auriculariae TaxID=2777116 RepID=A0A8S1GZY7_9PELO|nr:unnamed protein product [Caenorhabditis auriculariae]
MLRNVRAASGCRREIGRTVGDVPPMMDDKGAAQSMLCKLIVLHCTTQGSSDGLLRAVDKGCIWRRRRMTNRWWFGNTADRRRQTHRHHDLRRFVAPLSDRIGETRVDGVVPITTIAIVF